MIADGYLQHVDPDRRDRPEAAGPGQFISVYTKDGGKLLPRPISICEIRQRSRDSLRIVYRVTGEGTGTEQFSRLQAGDTVDIMGPLGQRISAGRPEGKACS